MMLGIAALNEGTHLYRDPPVLYNERDGSVWLILFNSLLRYRLINLKFRSYTAPTRSHVAT